jgi:hypothetical protein
VWLGNVNPLLILLDPPLVWSVFYSPELDSFIKL